MGGTELEGRVDVKGSGEKIDTIRPGQAIMIDLQDVAWVTLDLFVVALHEVWGFIFDGVDLSGQCLDLRGVVEWFEGSYVGDAVLLDAPGSTFHELASAQDEVGNEKDEGESDGIPPVADSNFQYCNSEASQGAQPHCAEKCFLAEKAEGYENKPHDAKTKLTITKGFDLGGSVVGILDQQASALQLVLGAWVYGEPYNACHE